MAAIDLGSASLIRALPGGITVSQVLGGSLNIGQWGYVAADGDMEAARANAATTLEGLGLLVGLSSNSGVGKTAGVAGDTGTFLVYGFAICGGADLTPGDIGYISSATAGAVVDAAPASPNFVKQAFEVWRSNLILVKPGGVAVVGA